MTEPEHTQPPEADPLYADAVQPTVPPVLEPGPDDVDVEPTLPTVEGPVSE